MTSFLEHSSTEHTYIRMLCCIFAGTYHSISAVTNLPNLTSNLVTYQLPWTCSDRIAELQGWQ